MRSCVLLLLALLPDCGSLPQPSLLSKTSGPATTRVLPPLVSCLRGGKGVADVVEGPEPFVNELSSNRDFDLWVSVQKGDLQGIHSAVSLEADVNSPLDWLAEYLPEAAVSFPTVPPSTSTVHKECKPTGGARGWKPLHLAAWLGQPGVIQALLLHGADATATSSSGTTPMHLAAHGMYIGERSFTDAMADYGRVMELLREAGAGVDGRDSAGWTPLLLAARSNRPTLLLQLLDYGADAEALDKVGVGALEHAKDLELHPTLRDATLQVLKHADVLKLRNENRERWHLGVTLMLWKTGVELTLHLFGYCVGFKLKRHTSEGEATLSLFSGHDPWNFGPKMLKKGWPFALRAHVRRIEVAGDQVTEVGKDDGAQKDADAHRGGKTHSAAGEGVEITDSEARGKREREEKMRLTRAAHTQEHRADDSRKVQIPRDTGRPSPRSLTTALASTSDDSSAAETTTGDSYEETSTEPSREDPQADAVRKLADPAWISQGRSKLDKARGRSDSLSSLSSSDDKVFYEPRKPHDAQRDISPSSQHAPPACVRLSRRGLWSCMWCLFPGFGQIVPRDHVFGDP